MRSELGEGHHLKVLKEVDDDNENTLLLHTVILPLKVLRHGSCIWKKLPKLFKIVTSNLFQSSPSSAILVPFCSRMNLLVFIFLSGKPLLLGFTTLEPQFRPSIR